MHRGTNLASGIAIDEGTNPHGVRSIIRFAGETMVIQRQQDMEPILRHVQAMRERNEGKGWGEGREIGHIPEIFYAKIVQIQDPIERKKTVKEFFKQNPAFCAYDAYLKA